MPDLKKRSVSNTGQTEGHFVADIGFAHCSESVHHNAADLKTRYRQSERRTVDSDCWLGCFTAPFLW
jgi:hypothetical protein